MDNQQLVAPNSCTIGDTYTASVMCDEQQYVIEFYLGTRDGSTKPMIIETLRHFISAISSVANGDVDSAEGMVTPRTGYGRWEHNESRVTIWVKAPGVPVLMPRGMRFVQVNVFTEATSAQDFIDSVNEHIYTMADVVESGAVALKAARQPKPKNELDNHFGERKPQAQTPQKQASQQQQAPPQRTDHQPADPNDTPRLGSYNYKLKADYQSEYGGLTVRFDVLKMKRIFDSRDASPLIQVYSSYNGGLSQYPAHDLKVKPNRLEKVDDYTRMILQAVLDGEENNSAHEGSYYMFVNDEGKMYPVLSKLTLKGQADSHYDDTGYERDANSPDNIPF